MDGGRGGGGAAAVEAVVEGVAGGVRTSNLLLTNRLSVVCD
jgi:hypothetical protein